MYALYNEGKICGYTMQPNSESTVPVDEESPEWLEFVAAQKARKEAEE